MSKSKFVLGKGLGALIPAVHEATKKKVSVQQTAATRDDGHSIGIIAHIEVAKIHPNPYQPRFEFDHPSLVELSKSILQKGVIQPVTVRRFGDGEYQLIAGERRVRACQEAKIFFIPAYIISVHKKEEMIELSLIENIQRERLNPIEIATSYQRLVDECKYTQDVIAVKVGKDRATVANTMRLLKLPDQIQKSLIRNDISMGHARAIISVPSPKQQLHIWQKIIKDRLSVRNVEKLVQDLTRLTSARRSKSGKLNRSRSEQYEKVKGMISKIEHAFGTKVQLHIQKSGKGKVEIEFYSADDMDRIFDVLLSLQKK